MVGGWIQVECDFDNNKLLQKVNTMHQFVISLRRSYPHFHLFLLKNMVTLNKTMYSITILIYSTKFLVQNNEK